MPQSPIAINASQKITENDKPTQVFRLYLKKVSESVPIVGAGSPEGALEAPQYTVYIDESVPLTPVTYRKMLPEISGDRKQGWAVV